MNRNSKLFLVAGLAAALWLGAARPVSAQTQLKFVISGTILSQGKTNGSGSRINAPVRKSLTVGSILRQLALDEKSAGLWASDSFPEAARLHYVSGTGFQVVNGAGNPLLNASNILTLTIASSNVFESALQSASGAYDQTNWQLMALTYNATNFGGSSLYTVFGFATVATKAAKPNKDGYYTETQWFSLQNGSGEGIDADGNNILLTGVTLTAKGTGVLNNGSASSQHAGVDEFNSGGVISDSTTQTGSSNPQPQPPSP
jgi:hypothetical protein